jgi:putative toxin-antitoxin system antitoxin component (TIGR02293 family)
MDVFRPPTPAPSGLLRDLGLGGGRGALIEAVKAGLAVDVFVALARRLRVSEAALAEVVGLSGTTLARRKRAGTLAPDEGDRVMRIVGLLERASEVFGDEDEAAAWLAAANPALEHVTPLALADTELGGREVDDLLGRLEHGVYS